MDELAEFDYSLEESQISQNLHHPREMCKLLVVNRSNNNSVEERLFSDLQDFVLPGDVIVVNNTAVSRSKLVGKKSTGGKVELTLMNSNSANEYTCRLKGGRLQKGNKLLFRTGSCVITRRENDVFTVVFDKLPSKSEFILPTPPYVRAKIPEADYQTIFSKQDGSLAAPTAGLHFSPRLVQQLIRKGAKFVEVTLHIGFGTFLPVRDASASHTEPELVEITPTAANIINNAKRVIAVGTTSVKALETASKNGRVHPMKGTSTIFIKPGFCFQSKISAMITNFHMPRSSLLMLTCAFGGTQHVMNAYQYAPTHGFKVGSLGDAMLVYKKTHKFSNKLFKQVHFKIKRR